MSDEEKFLDKPKEPSKKLQASCKKRIKKIDILAAILGLFTLVAAYEDNDSLLYNEEYSTNMSFLLRSSIYIISITLEVLIYLRYHIKEREKFPSLSYMLEAIILFICPPPPNLDYEIETHTKGMQIHLTVGDIVLVLMVSRVYLLVRMYPHLSKWTCSSEKDKMRFQADKGTIFAFRSDLEGRNFMPIYFILVTTLLVFAIPLLVIERSFKTVNSAEGMDSLANILWMIIETFSTVGYGELYPSFPLGRIILAIT